MQELARGLSKQADPLAADPAQLMTLVGMTPDPWQSELLQSQWQRALLLCSRQSGKSTAVGALATHAAQYDAGSLTLLLGAAQRQAQELFRKVKAFYFSMPDRVPVKQESALQLELTNGSRVIALPGKEETIRGYSGVDLLVIDEAARVPDELYASVRPMLAVSGGRLIALSTPFGTRGWFYEAWRSEDDWQRHKVTAYQCPRISAEFLEEERRTLGHWWFAQEYEVQFMDAISAAFRHEDIEALFPVTGVLQWAL